MSTTAKDYLDSAVRGLAEILPCLEVSTKEEANVLDAISEIRAAARVIGIELEVKDSTK